MWGSSGARPSWQIRKLPFASLDSCRSNTLTPVATTCPPGAPGGRRQPGSPRPPVGPRPPMGAPALTFSASFTSRRSRRVTALDTQ